MGSAAVSLYQTLLGRAWYTLTAHVQAMHLPGQMEGSFDVTRATGFLARLLSLLLGFPASGTARTVQLTITARGAALVWTRNIGGTRLVTAQWVVAGKLIEQLGPIRCVFDVQPRDGGVDFVQEHAALALGPWSLRLPRWLSPRVSGRVRAATAPWVRVDVEIQAPFMGPVLHYAGEVRPLAVADSVTEARA
jgi:hypothetical protein